MIGHCCKYTPLELLEALGGEPVLLDEAASDFEAADALTHSSLCCHAKSVIQQAMQMEELVLTDCCDSMRRSFDVLKTSSCSKYRYFMELPHDDSQCARQILKRSLLALMASYSRFQGIEFQKDVFLRQCRASQPQHPSGPWIAVMGARIPPELLRTIQKKLPLTVVNLTCSGNRNLELPPDNADEMSVDELMDWYAGALLRMTPCMRMSSPASRRSLTEDPMLRGIVYHTVKFCDYYGFEYADLKRRTTLPILKMESDYTHQPSGQLATRLDAFCESLGLEPHSPAAGTSAPGTGLFAGIDSGSTTTSMVVIDGSGKILASSIVRTGAKAQNGASAALNEVCNTLGITPDRLESVMATGYGRSSIPFATCTKTEITCHARGAFSLNPEIRTIIDIGGQDSKVICLDSGGAVINFVMNDKCAAGTGRFLEMMARTLELDLEEMSTRGLQWKQDLTISSMCTVFAESEVISLIADNHSEGDIVHGLNKSIATKTASMVRRAKGAVPYMMTGGVARNQGVVRELEQRLQAKIYIPPEPDLCGALGAALLARDGG